MITSVRREPHAFGLRATRTAACLWALIFAWVHVYWLAGGSIGLPSAIAETRPQPLMVAAAVAVPLLTIAAIAMLIGPAWPMPLARRLARLGAVAVSLFCLIHSVPPLLTAFADLLSGRFRVDENRLYDVALYEPNWLLGGLLFGLAWRDWTRSESARLSTGSPQNGAVSGPSDFGRRCYDRLRLVPAVWRADKPPGVHQSIRSSFDPL